LDNAEGKGLIDLPIYQDANAIQIVEILLGNAQRVNARKLVCIAGADLKY
jgi:hypothetical protein